MTTKTISKIRRHRITRYNVGHHRIRQYYQANGIADFVKVFEVEEATELMRGWVKDEQAR